MRKFSLPSLSAPGSLTNIPLLPSEENIMVRRARWFCLSLFWGWSAWAWAASVTPPLYILQANDQDPTAPTSQPSGRWYHWLGCDPAVTHLETGLAIDSAAMAGRGQRIRLAAAAPVAAIQVKVKRIGRPGPLCWEAGTAWGRDDLGHGQIPARSRGRPV